MEEKKDMTQLYSKMFNKLFNWAARKTSGVKLRRRF
jgi:hypothetical protein